MTATLIRRSLYTATAWQEDDKDTGRRLHVTTEAKIEKRHLWSRGRERIVGFGTES
jgi:hypothetical protein